MPPSPMRSAASWKAPLKPMTSTILRPQGPGQAGRDQIIGAVDETFLERMILVFMDLATGYLVLEEVADDRT